MADKEERIRVEIIDVCKRPKNKDMYKCDCIGSPNEMAGLQVCPIHPQVVAKEGISKQEAIEVMAKAIFNKYYEYTYKWEVANEETKTVFRLYAREALNVLLEGVKK